MKVLFDLSIGTAEGPSGSQEPTARLRYGDNLAEVILLNAVGMGMSLSNWVAYVQSAQSGENNE